jgi:hypothetical protein
MRNVVRLVERRRNGQLELVAVDVGVEHGDDESVTAPDAHGQPALDALLRGLADRFDAVLRAARASVEMQLENGEQVAPTLRTRREMSDEFLTDMARRHANLRADGLPPTKTLAEQEAVSVATVKHWLRKARERGLLGPALKGRAGEAKTTKEEQ